MLPTRVLLDILKLSPKILSRMKRQKSEMLNVEEYSTVERSAFGNATKFLKSVLPRLNYKPFRFSKVTNLFIFIFCYVCRIIQFISRFILHDLYRIAYGVTVMGDIIFISTYVHIIVKKVIQRRIYVVYVSVWNGSFS
jgi:hypothetical protein